MAPVPELVALVCLMVAVYEGVSGAGNPTGFISAFVCVPLAVALLFA